jgi:hypothetical protein
MTSTSDAPRLITTATGHDRTTLEALLAHPAPERITRHQARIFSMHRIGPLVGPNFWPASNYVSVYADQVWTGPELYFALFYQIEEDVFREAILLALDITAHRWQGGLPGNGLTCNLSVVQYALTRPGFDEWFVDQHQSGRHILPDLKRFIRKLEDGGILPAL